MLEACGACSPRAGRTPGSSSFSPRKRRSVSSVRSRSTSKASRAGRIRLRQAAPIGEVVLGAPSACKLDIGFHGRASHAGMVPEEGRSAIAAAARAISEMPLGRIDEETTANMGLIQGGSAVNIVPEWCTLRRRGPLPRRA